MKARIVDNQMPATVGIAAAQCAQEVAKLQVGMALIALREHFAGAHIKGGKEIDSPMTDILSRLKFSPWR
jgi:hypothetical protein